MKPANITIHETELPDIGKDPARFWKVNDLHRGVTQFRGLAREMDLSDCLALRLPGRPWLLQLWEPLATKAPSPSRCQPHCCYIRTVIFYHRPYIPGPNRVSRWLDGKVHVEKGCFAEFDKIKTRLGWDEVVRFEGDLFKCDGGTVVWRHRRWWLFLTARRCSPLLAID